MATKFMSAEISELIDEIQATGHFETVDQVVLQALLVLKKQISNHELLALVEERFRGAESASSVAWKSIDQQELLENARLRAERGERPARHVIP